LRMRSIYPAAKRDGRLVDVPQSIGVTTGSPTSACGSASH
jgi:hypothetical protein